MIKILRLSAACVSLASALFCAAALNTRVTAVTQREEPAYRIAYTLAMPRPESHLFEVKIEITAARSSDKHPKSISLQMPKWSPGRYAVYDFAKNVQEFRAAPGVCPAANCAPADRLPVNRTDTQTWTIETGENKSFTINYRVFADNLSGTFSQLDPRHANFNPASIFMYVVGHKQDAVDLKIEPPAGWRIINGATTGPDQREWSFANYDLLIDTPTEIAPDWTLDEFKVNGKQYRVVVHSFGDEAGRRPQLVRDIERIVRAAVEMWGRADFDGYTFLIHFANDNQSSDGMEHLTSTQIIEPGALAGDETFRGAVGTAAHEFFHAWNVKRLRPVELGPWDFTRPVATRSLWIAEGLTNYYGQLMMHRAGVWSAKELLDGFSRTITDVENAPGSRLTSAEEASMIASFIDRTPHLQRTNLRNTVVSYYAKGEVLGLTLDLMIRGRSAGRRSLDDVMRRMYDEFYVKSPKATYYLQGRGYTAEDFARVASAVAGSNLDDFFARYVRGTEVPPYDDALGQIGMRLVRQPDGSRYRIEELKEATAQQRALRAVWLAGKNL